MKIAINSDRSGAESYSDKWTEFLEKRGVSVFAVDLRNILDFETIKRCDGFMWRWLHTPEDKLKARRFLPLIEFDLNKPVFPNYKTCWHYDDKVAQYLLLSSRGVSIPETWLFWSREEAIQWCQTATYPVIFKLTAGASASNVLMLRNQHEAVRQINSMFWEGVFPMTMNEHAKSPWPKSFSDIKPFLRRFKSGVTYGILGKYPALPPFWWQPEKGYAYFQEFIPGNDFDTRITVIGNRAFALRRFNRKGDFRASGSGLLDYARKEINMDCVRMAFDTSRKFGFQSMAYDFLVRSNGQPVIVEISYTFIDKFVYQCPGHWNEKLEWIEGGIWPEEAQVIDFIDHINSKSNS
jgi:hypothetical protein